MTRLCFACQNGRITFVSPERFVENAKLWSLDRASSRESMIGPAPAEAVSDTPAGNGCAHFAKSGDIEACGTDEDLTLSKAGKAIGHIQIATNECPLDDRGTIGRRQTPIETLEWSRDSKWLLVGELGLDTGSTAPQYDYYVIDPDTMKPIKAASAAQDEMLWLPGRDRLVYVTPVDLAPLPGTGRKREVWVQQLMLFDPAANKTTAITSGVSDNRDVSLCK